MRPSRQRVPVKPGPVLAVVAEEVRNLAMRSSEAAKNTSGLIEHTVKSVKQGNDLTLATQGAFKETVDIAGKIGQLISEIAEASQEQSRGFSEVNKAVNEIDKVVQQAAANAEESASASEELNAQAEQMKMYVRELVQVIGGQANDNGNGYRIETDGAKFISQERRLRRNDHKMILPISGQTHPVIPLTEAEQRVAAISMSDENVKRF